MCNTTARQRRPHRPTTADPRQSQKTKQTSSSCVISACREAGQHRMRMSLQGPLGSVVFEAEVLEKGSRRGEKLHMGPCTCFMNVVLRKKCRGSRCHSGHSLMTGARYPKTALWDANRSCGLSMRFWLRGASWEVWSRRHTEHAG